MKNKEKILRWDLQKSKEVLNSDIGEYPIALAFAVMESRKNKVNQCQKELDDYLKINVKREN